jgi:hypothetical protein
MPPRNGLTRSGDAGKGGSRGSRESLGSYTVRSNSLQRLGDEEKKMEVNLELTDGGVFDATYSQWCCALGSTRRTGHNV